MVRSFQPIHQRSEVSLTNALRRMLRRPLRRSTAVTLGSDDADRHAGVDRTIGGRIHESVRAADEDVPWRIGNRAINSRIIGPSTRRL